MTVLALDDRATNSALMIACRDLGYIDDRVLDLTYGLGTFWRDWVPENLIASDLDPAKSPIGHPVDFTATGYDDQLADTVVLDPPYKLAGRATAKVDGRYGIDDYMSVEARHQLIRDGITEAARIIAPGGHLLLKCQDQVCSGRVHWQTRIFADHAETVGFTLIDALLFPSFRPQPEGRSQVHARRNYSTLLVLRRSVS
jgi:hypothetical protein